MKSINEEYKDTTSWTEVDRPFEVEFDTVRTWCKINCAGRYQLNIWTLEFEFSTDAVLFKLKFA